MRYTPTIAPRPHHRVVEATLRDELALFHLDSRRLHLLNGSAAAIWDQLHRAETVGDVTVGIGDRFDVDPHTVRNDVERTIEQFRADGLLSLDDRVVSRSSRADPWDAPQGPVAAPLGGSFAALDARVGIVSDDSEIVATVERVLAPLRVDDPPVVTIEVVSSDEFSWTVTVGGRSEATVGSRLSAVLRVIAEMNTLAVASVPDDLVFHAGAVSDGDQAVLLPAASNHGKSTLTTALVADGLSYLTDEAAAVTAELSVRPFAKSIALDPGSFPLFEALVPPSAGGDLAKAMACREWHVDPAEVGTIAGPAPVAAVVCPHWRAGASTRLTALVPSEALHLLLGETFDFALGGQPLFERLVRLVDVVPVFRLGYSDLGEAVATVRTVLADPTGISLSRDSSRDGSDGDRGDGAARPEGAGPFGDASLRTASRRRP
jgi:Coenzyme PQQ synthesis protein D (PqqD)